MVLCRCGQQLVSTGYFKPLFRPLKTKKQNVWSHFILGGLNYYVLALKISTMYLLWYESLVFGDEFLSTFKVTPEVFS